MSKLGTFITLVGILCAVNAVADMPRDYYPDDLEGRNKGDLKTELHKLIKDHRRIEYGKYGTWVVFRESDIRDDGTVWDMYSNIDRYFPASGAAKGMNIEHSVPKSWWGDDYPYTVDGSFDLHHLVPADADANSAKSNYALGEVDGTPAFNNGVSKVGKATGYSFNVFEPADEYKGDFARMYMYFVTCYQDYSWRSLGTNMFITGAYPTLNSYSQNLLLKWHRNDPVSRKEIDRNNAVYRHQFNRNPFIDYPQMAEYIWGDSVNFAFRFEGEPIVAPLLNYKTGDVIIFDSEVYNGSRTMAIQLCGENITSQLMLSIDDTQHFDVENASIDASDVTSAGGATLYITYHPRDYGIHTAHLVIACDDLPDDVVIELKGVCMPQQPAIISVDDLKSSYRISDADMQLSLSNCNETVEWYIDGVKQPDGILSPKALTVGRHTISFKTNSVCGKVRITITQ